MFGRLSTAVQYEYKKFSYLKATITDMKKGMLRLFTKTCIVEIQVEDYVYNALIASL